MWGLIFKSYKNQLFKNLCLRMSNWRGLFLNPVFCRNFLFRYLWQRVEKIRAVSSVNMAPNWRGLFPNLVLCRKFSFRYLWQRCEKKIRAVSSVNMAPNWWGLFTNPVLKYERFQVSTWPPIDEDCSPILSFVENFRLDICGSVFCRENTRGFKR